VARPVSFRADGVAAAPSSSRALRAALADAVAMIDAVTNIAIGSARLAAAVTAVGVDDRRPDCHPLHLRGACRRASPAARPPAFVPRLVTALPSAPPTPRSTLRPFEVSPPPPLKRRAAPTGDDRRRRFPEHECCTIWLSRPPGRPWVSHLTHRW